MRNATVALLIVGLLGAAASPAAAQVVPDPIIAPVVFHWVQNQTPWPTLEGGSVAGASRLFWRRQTEHLESAGFTAQLFQVAWGATTSQRNHLLALRDRRDEQPDGPLPPRVIPFFAAETFQEYSVPKDVLSPEGFEVFYSAIRGFFVMYGEVFPARPGDRGPLDTRLLARVDGRVFIALWWVPLTSYDLPVTFFERLSDRLERDFGFRAYWSVHEWFEQGGPDDVHYLFNGMPNLQRGRSTANPSVDLLVGFWPPSLNGYAREMFVPRAGGNGYAAAWDAVIAMRPRPSIVLVESYNEITEGSHLMPSWPVDHFPGDGHWTGPPDDPRCLTQPCHPLEFTDQWGSGNPWHYLDLTKRKILEWLVGPAVSGVDRVAPHAFIQTPKTDEEASGAIPLKILAADDVAIRSVKLYLDGDLILETDRSIDTRLKTWFLANGRHRLLVQVEDQAGNRDTDLSDFVVANAADLAAGVRGEPVFADVLGSARVRR